MKASAFVCFVVVLAIAIGLPGVSMGAEETDWEKVIAAGKKEGSVVAASSTFEGEAAVAAMKAFKDLYGIKLEFIPGRMVTATEKIMVEQKSGSYVTDCIDTYGTSTILLRKAGYLDRVVDKIPVLKEEKDKFIGPITDDPEGLMINIAGMDSNMWVNTTLVKPQDEPKSWFDLLDPKWNGKIYLMSPVHNSGPEQVLAGFTEQCVLSENFFIRLYRDAVIGGPGGGSALRRQLVRGEVAIAGPVGTSGRKTYRDGAPIKPLDLKEGRLGGHERWVAIKNRPHPNATLLFINWALSREAQTIVAKLSLLDPVRNDVPVPPYFDYKKPKVELSIEGLELSAKRRRENYMADKLGIKR